MRVTGSDWSEGRLTTQGFTSNLVGGISIHNPSPLWSPKGMVSMPLSLPLAASDRRSPILNFKFKLVDSCISILLQPRSINYNRYELSKFEYVR